MREYGLTKEKLVWYICPFCNRAEILRHYRYCPICGKVIDFTIMVYDSDVKDILTLAENV